MRWAARAAVLVLLVGGPMQASEKAKKADDFFGVTKIHQFHFVVDLKDWEKMQPKGGMTFGRPPQGQPQGQPRSGFGIEYPEVPADVQIAGKTYKKVGIRFKGNSTALTATGRLKRSIKVDFNQFDDKQTFQGLKKLNLHNAALDPSYAREQLGYALFRSAKLPAPRTALAEVTLTVPGKYKEEYVGLYIITEAVDRTFLKDRFGSSKGLLLKPERVAPLGYLGEDWKNYESSYYPKTEVKKKQAQRLIDFTRLVQRADDAKFNKEIGSYIDVDQFLRFLACNVVLSNLDSFLGLNHNYYLYLDAQTNKFVIIPWDMDLSFAGMFFLGSAQQLADLSLMKPYVGENRLIDRVLAIPEYAKKYGEHCKTMVKELEKLVEKELPRIEAAVKEPKAREAKAVAARREGRGFGMPMMGQTDLRNFVKDRARSVVAQVEGKSKGFTPVFGFGRPAGGFGPGGFLARQILDAVDGNKDRKLSKEEFVEAAKKLFKHCDTDGKGSVDEKMLTTGLSGILPQPRGFGGPQGQPRPEAGAPWAAAVMRRADANKDGKVSLAEMTAAAEILFKEWDKDKNGTLEEKELADGLNAVLPPPRFGPPPANPPAGRGEGRP